MASADATVFLWINGWVGRFSVVDTIAKVVVSDYLIPVFLALTLLALWFAGKDRDTRERYQKAVFVGASAIGISNLVVFVINHLYFRPRPFTQYEVSLLFYQPTDSSFPANPAAIAFAVAATVWAVNRGLGWALFAVASVFSISRVYAGVFYPSDILAGAMIGIVAAYVLSRVRILLEPLPTLVIRLARIFCLA